MTTPLIAPLIPPRARPGGREHGRPAAVRRLPVAAALEIPAVPDDVLYGFGRIDGSGRVADRAMTSSLGWRPGDRLTLTAAGAGVVIARRDPGGMVTLPAKPYIVIPAALRRRCGLRPGDRVLLAVFPARDALAAYSFAVVDRALREHAPVLGEGRQP
jgi:bifunctional DNA-binding transcriptional regulator/antitoxin component of YhaV-PrlF toxin-antitoxin module